MRTIITVDVEAHRGSDPVSSFIWGKTANGEEYGLKKMCDIFSEYGYKAIFFVDFAECFDYGEKKIKEVVDYLKTTPHHIGVHIHPDHMADRKRQFLFQYTYDEQYNIIKKCTDLFFKFVGEAPLAFRAGKYSANRDTLSILSKLGYEYDFSEFYGNPWCGIKPPVCILYPTIIESGLKEIPVTVFTSVKLLSIYQRIDKIDLTMHTTEFSKVMSSLKDKNYSDADIIISLFFHSFSLLKNRGNPEALLQDLEAELRLRRALNISYKMKCTPISIEDLRTVKFLNISENNLVDTHSNLPTNGNILYQLYFSILRLFAIAPTNRKARLLLIGFSVVFFVFVMIVFILLR